jgi:hypothetical protein
MTQPEIEKMILEDIKKRFKIPAEKISISEIHRTDFPPGINLYRAEKRLSYGNTFFNYIFASGEIYCSSDENAFQRLIANEKLLEREDWKAEEFAALFLCLVIHMRDLKLVESADELIGEDEPVTSPELSITGSGVSATFWTYQIRYQKLDRWHVQVGADYSVSWER